MKEKKYSDNNDKKHFDYFVVDNGNQGKVLITKMRNMGTITGGVYIGEVVDVVPLENDKSSE